MITEQEFKSKVASNITKYRKQAGLTQGVLAEKLNYSDKSVSKWERGEGLPDIYVLTQMADIFGTSVGSILGEQAAVTASESVKADKQTRAKHRMIVAMSVGLVWLVAAVIFFSLIVAGVPKSWLAFVTGVPISFIVMIVLSCIWYGNIFRCISVSGLIWTLFPMVMVAGGSAKYAFFLIICAIMQVLTVLWFVMRHKFGGHKAKKTEAEEAEELAETEAEEN